MGFDLGRHWPALGIVAGALLAGYALLAPKSDEERIRGQLDALAAAVRWERADGHELERVLRIKKLFSEAFAEDVSFSVPDLSPPSPGRAGLTELALESARVADSIELSFKDVQAHVDGSAKRALVSADAWLTVDHRGQLDRDRRKVTLRWTKDDGAWRIHDVAASGPDRDQPEARP